MIPSFARPDNTFPENWIGARVHSSPDPVLGLLQSHDNQLHSKLGLDFRLAERISCRRFHPLALHHVHVMDRYRIRLL